MVFKKIWWKNIIVAAVLFSSVLLLSWIFLPFYSSAPINILIPAGADSFEIANILRQQAVIKNKFLFILLSKVLNWEKDLKAGNYEFSSSNMIDVLGKLKKGGIKRSRVTIPEGLPEWEVSQILEKEKIIKKNDFLALVNDPGIFKEEFSFLLSVESLEGYLYPDTYYFFVEENEVQVIRKFLLRFQEIVLPLYEEKIPKNNLSAEEIIILASIVEKEAQINLEKPIIAAVFHNRLEKGMKLRADPTVKYALGNFQERLTYEDLTVSSPYNTYVYHGLPPGPICNPGKDSIYAVLYPDEVDYFYFVAKGDGTHKFSDTYEEHLKAVYKYRKEKINDSITSGS